MSFFARLCGCSSAPRTNETPANRYALGQPHNPTTSTSVTNRTSTAGQSALTTQAHQTQVTTTPSTSSSTAHAFTPEQLRAYREFIIGSPALLRQVDEAIKQNKPLVIK